MRVIPCVLIVVLTIIRNYWSIFTKNIENHIMNKSAPAGNVLRKQISLLPKYQLTMTPTSSDKVSIQLTLLNHAYLAENMDQLTAGETHKCHIVVGDSENHILLLTCFKDKDLIGVYNGTITYEITRKHNFENKVFVHCISSTFVGLDVQSEYLFKGLEPLISRGESIAYPMEGPTTKKIFKKQTTITDTFKERKRKLNYLNISQSKEKKKRDSVDIEKFRHSKDSFGKSSTEATENQQKPVEISNESLRQMTIFNTQVREFSPKNNIELACENNDDYDTIVREYKYPEMISEDLDNEHDFIADDHFDNILTEIENEISKSRHFDGPANSQKHTTPQATKPYINNPNPFGKPNYKLLNPKRPAKPTRSNYNFIELLQKNENLSNENDNTYTDGGFSDTIKSLVEKFITKTTTNTANIVDPAKTELISSSLCSKLPDKQVKNMESCTEDLILQNNKAMDEDTTIILKPPNSCIMVPEELVSLKEHDIEITAEIPEVEFGTCRSNKDTSQMAIKGAKNNNQNDFIHENKHNNNKESLVYLINQRNNFKNTAENISPEMFVDYVTNKREPTSFSQELLKSPCDMKKFDHRLHEIVSEKINNSKITIFEQERNKNKESENLEITKDETDYVVEPDSHEKYTPKPNLSDINNKQSECANNHYKLSNLLMLPNFNTMSMSTSQRNTVNLDHELNQESIVKSNRLEKQPILYFNKHVGGIKPCIETAKQQSTHTSTLLPYNTNKEVNTIIPPSISAKSLQKTNDENWKNFELDDDTMKPAIRKEVSASFLPFNPKKEKCVNTYSFSTTKTDVQTKTHADLQVHIIRKLKIDLNITEILTRENKDVQNNKGNTTQTKNCVDNRMSCTHEAPNSIPKNSNKDELWPQVAFELDSIDEMCVQEKDVPKITQNLIQDVSEKEIANMQGHNLVKPQRTDDLKGRLGNILEKYSKILRKNGNLQDNGVMNDENKGINLTSKTVALTSRPYKIQDINKLGVSFPITIINGAPEVVKPNNDDIITRLKAPKQNNENFSAIMLPKTYPHILQVQVKTTEQVAEDYEGTALDEILPKTSNLEMVDFDIDQSMFNPKTLLQCLSKDTEFIPPPVQFSDDISTTHEAFHPSADFEIEENTEYPQSIFDKNSHTVLTPTKEIETWTFSQDDNEYKSFDLKESYTVMRINSPIATTATYNAPQNNRKAKLNQFTYKVKNKLKI